MSGSPFALSAIAVSLALSASPARAAETFHTCTGFIDSVPATISTQGVWCLRRDLSTGITSGAAITVNANNVTLDCNDFKLGGLAAGINTTTSGVSSSSRLNTTVRNCSVRGFRRGISLSGAGAVVRDNRVEQNTQYGIYLDGDNGLVQRNLVGDIGSGPAAITSVTGIYASGTHVVDGNVVQNVIASNGANVSVYGIWAIGGSGASVSGNVVRNLVANGNGAANGIYTSNGAKVFITGNRVAATNAVGNGIRCNSSNGSLKDNVAWGFSESLDSSCLDHGGNAGL